MTINEYNRYGRVRDYFVLCEDPRTDNTPKLNRKGFAFAARVCDDCDDDGFYPCCILGFDLPDIKDDVASTGGLGRSVSFNPATEEFRFGPAVKKRDTVRPIDFDFYVTASRGTVDDLKQLIDKGANPDAPVYNAIDDDFYAIHQAALNPDINVLKFIVSLGINPCRTDFWWRQPLAFAVRKNSLEMARYLVGAGNDPCRVDMDGMTVLGESAVNLDIRVVEYLMSLGAKVDYGATDRTELGYALTDGTPERMQFFMDHGADLATAMEIKCYWAPLANIRYALEHGFDPNSFEDGTYADGHREKVIDHLTPKRRALFEEFGGRIHYPNAEIFGEEVEED